MDDPPGQRAARIVAQSFSVDDLSQSKTGTARAVACLRAIRGFASDRRCFEYTVVSMRRHSCPVRCQS